jgi:hypothetical protein
VTCFATDLKFDLVPRSLFCVVVFSQLSMSSSSGQIPREGEQSPGISFVRSSVKSVIKALSGRRQSPSPTFHRSLIEVPDDAEKTDREISEDLPTDSPGNLESHYASERGLDLDEPAENESELSELLKIRSLHEDEQEERKLEIPSDGEARHSEIRSDLGGFISRPEIRFRFDEVVYGAFANLGNFLPPPGHQ